MNSARWRNALGRLWMAAPIALAASCGTAGSTADSVTVSVAGGTFTMGSIADCKDAIGGTCIGDRTPHRVRVSPFRIDTNEVSRAQYGKCVASGACSPAGAIYDDQSDLPVVVNDPDAARKFCAVRKMRLPTEAEFEFASRIQPSGNAQTFAWGDTPPACGRLPLAGCDEQGVRPVGQSPGDVSPWGVHDLGGNVPEWVEDTYSPYIGCADHLGYGELCWGRGAGCADARCSLDSMFCQKSCLPPPATMSPATMAADAPVCLMAPAAAVLIDPVVRGTGPYGVVRGGGPSDGACAFAGFTRRYAAPKSYSAGFRCAVGVDMSQRKGIATYRFAIDQCPDSGRVRLELTQGGGGVVGYTLHWFSSGATGVGEAAPDDKGVIADVPCDAVMVVYPTGADSLQVKLTTVGNPDCLGATKMVTLNAGSDTPSPGIETIALAPANNCQ